jgi:hypothetical protein
VLLVDWTGLGPRFFILSAKVAFAGRAVSIYSRTFPLSRKASPAAEREFLNELKAIIPRSCRPVLVTDAGFLFRWFDSVRVCGWDYVGRIRGRIAMNIERRSLMLPQVHQLATRKPRDLGMVSVGKKNAREHRVVLSAKPKLKGRKRLGRLGLPLNGNQVDRHCREAAREPLLLLTSLRDPASVVVDIYRMRMQIEQTFRDLKSYRYGWCVRDIRSADARRVDVLLLIGAYAAVAMHLVGLAVRGNPLARGFQANTERRRNVFSTFFLGKLTFASGHQDDVPLSALRVAVTRFAALLKAASPAALPP